jgi:hypothetical protein
MEHVQNFLTYLILGGAIYFLLRKYVFKTPKKDKNCGPNCNC